jgi:hypothetical protein
LAASAAASAAAAAATTTTQFPAYESYRAGFFFLESTCRIQRQLKTRLR